MLLSLLINRLDLHGATSVSAKLQAHRMSRTCTPVVFCCRSLLSLFGKLFQQRVV